MTIFSNTRYHPWIGYVTPTLSLVIIISAIGVILGWITKIFFVQAFSRSFIPMAPSTALIFFLLGFSLLPRSGRVTEQTWTKMLRILTLLSLILSVIILIQYIINNLTSLHLDLERILVEQYLVPGQYVAGRMSPLTSILLIICSFSMFRSTFKLSSLFNRANHILILLVLATSMVLILGYIFGAPILYGGATIPVALPTSILMFLLSIGYLFQSPGRWLYDFTLAKEVFAVILRWLIPMTMGIFFIIGIIHFYYTESLSRPGQALVFAITTILSALLVALLVSFVAKYVQKLVNHAEQQLLDTNSELQALIAAQNKFLSILSHDLRSPFNTILGYTDILMSSFDSQTTEENLKLLNRLQNSAHSTFKLLENLLEWSRVKSGNFILKLERIELSVLMEECVQTSLPYADQKQVSIDNQCNSEVMILADVLSITTIIRNLLNNAIKFSTPHTSIIIKCIVQKSECRVTISDQGIGMDQSLKDLLFRQETKVNRPGTNREKGTGLGLLLVHDLVIKNGGRIWVDSDPGKGSAFHFTIPMV